MGTHGATGRPPDDGAERGVERHDRQPAGHGPPHGAGHEAPVSRLAPHRRSGPRLRTLLPDADVVPHRSAAPEGAPLPELSLEALHDVQHPHVDDVDGWYYDQPPFDLDWVLGTEGFDLAPGEGSAIATPRARRQQRTSHRPSPA